MDYIELCLVMNCTDEKFAKLMHYQELKTLEGCVLIGWLIVVILYIFTKNIGR